MKGVTLQHNYLMLPLPAGWEDASQVIAIGQEDSGFRPNVIFSQEPALAGENAAKFAARHVVPLRRTLVGYAILKEENTTFGPNSGFLREHTFRSDGRDMGQIQFYMVIAYRAYTFTFTHLKDKFPGFRPLAIRMLEQARLALPRGTAAEEPSTIER
ncbi:MAG: DcrB-related protein [Bryobacteraceae bacterium]